MQCCGMEEVGTEHHQVDNGVIHRKARNVASQRILVTTEHGVQHMAELLRREGQGWSVDQLFFESPELGWKGKRTTVTRLPLS